MSDAERLASYYKADTMPPWLQDMSRRIAESGEAISREAYRPYTGQRLSQFAPEFMPTFVVQNQQRISQLQKDIHQLESNQPLNEEDAARLNKYKATLGAIKYSSDAGQYGSNYASARRKAEEAQAAFEENPTPENQSRYDLTQSTLQALTPASVASLTREGLSGHRAPLAKAQELLGRAGQEFPGRYADYASPHTQAVVNKIEEDSGRFFREKLMPALSSKFIRAGQHGGGKHQQAMTQMTRDLAADVSGRQSQAREAGYQQAGQLFNADQARALQAARGYGDVVGTQQQARIGDITALRDLAAAKQQQEQQRLDIGREDAIREQEYPARQLAAQQAILAGTPIPLTQVSSQMAPSVVGLNLPGQLGAAAQTMLGQQLAHRKRGGSFRMSPAHINYMRGRK